MSGAFTIDLITYDEGMDEFVLYLVEDGPWPGDEQEWKERMEALQDRIFSAADVAIDGHLVEKYPDSKGKRIRIQVDSPSGCPDQVASLVAAAERFFADDPSYSSAIRSSPDIRDLRVVTGKHMGRFGESG